MALVLILSILSAWCGNTFSAATSTVGREFFVGVLNSFADDEFTLVLTSEYSGRAEIRMPYLNIDTTRSFTRTLEYTVSRDIVTRSNTTLETKGIHVTTDVDVSLVVIKTASNTCEGFLVLPSAMLSTKYVTSSYSEHSGHSSYYSDFLILSLHDNNTVRVNGRTLPVSMNFLDTYLHRSPRDLSGVIVDSNKQIAVFSGREAASVPQGCSDGGEFIVEQLLPTIHFSNTFIVPPLPPKSGHVTRVYTSEGQTAISHSDSKSNNTITLSSAGRFYEKLSHDEPLLITTNKPVQVMLYATCNTFNNDGIGNSFMSVVPSIQQFASSYHFTVSSAFRNFDHYLIIISKDEYFSGLRMNGVSMKRLFRSYHLSHGQSNYTVNVYNITAGIYHLHGNGGTFGAFLYGYRDRNSYGYALGLTIAKGCDMPNVSSDVNVLIHNRTSGPISASFDCNTGFVMKGPSTITCQADGSWDKHPPTCVIQDCGNLTSPANGYIDLSNGTVVGSHVFYSCVAGYILKGQQKRPCLANGHWNGSQPVCLKSGGGFTCLNCKDMTHLDLCDTVTTCSVGQKCYVKTIRTEDGQVRYNSGCVDSEQCGVWASEAGKRSSECAHCCSSQLCNMNGCGSKSLPTADLRGPLCYDCAYVQNMAQCKTMTLCARDEVCSVEKYDWGGLYDHYTAKCHSKQCISHKRSYTGNTALRMSSRSTPVCQSCCNTDLCNVGCNVTSQAGTGSSIVG